MASSTFSTNQASQFFPKVCKPKPKPPLIPFPIGLPPKVGAYYRWTDLDPGKEIDRSGYIILNKLPAPRSYSGEYSENGLKTQIELTGDPETDYWTVTVSVWDPWRNPDVVAWPDVESPPGQPLDTGLLTITTIPGIDFQDCHVMT